MGFWNKILGRRENEGSAESSPQARKQRSSGSLGSGSVVSIKLPPEVDGTGDFNVRNIIKGNNKTRLRQILEELPIESITLDQTLSGDTRQHDRLFELCIHLSSILVNYKTIRKEHPEFGLPAGVPSQELANILVPRFVEQIRKQHGPDVIVAAGHRIMSFAQDMIKGGRYGDALECLAVCKDAHTANRDEVLFWTWACHHNIATNSRKPEDLRKALSAAKAIPTHRRSEIKEAIEWTRKQLRNK